MSTQLDSLTVDLSLRNHQAVLSGIGQIRTAIAGVRATAAGGLAMKGLGAFASSNLSEIKMLLGAGGITAMVGVGTVKLAADLEKARLGLKRFVDTDFTGLSEGIDKLSYKIPIAVSGLYDIASGAAQVGITGTQNILAFTEVVGKLATVSNMSFNETAKDLAKLHNVFGLNAGDSPRTANVIAGLSAASAADPSELITTTKYLSGAASTIKFTLDQTIALSAAIKDAGISSEVGGTAFNKLILDMAKMPAEFAKITGMTTNDFKKLRDSNPVQALLKALKSIDSETSIDDKIAKSEAIGVESVRQSGALLQLIKALELFEEHLARATKFGDEKTVLDKQFNTQAESTYAKLQKLGNAFMQVADKLGGGISRGIGAVADALTAAALRLKEPGKVNNAGIGAGAGAPGVGINMGVPPVGGQFRPQNMGVPRGAGVVAPEKPAGPIGPPAPGLDEKAAADRKTAERLEEVNKELIGAKREEIRTIQAVAEAKYQMMEKERLAVKVAEDTHIGGAQKLKTVKRFEDAADEARRHFNFASQDRNFAGQNVTALEMEQRQLQLKNPFPQPVIPALANPANQGPQPLGAKALEGGRKFAFDKMIDPHGFAQFEAAFATMPAKWRDSDAGKALAEKLKAAGGADVLKNATEDELTQLIHKKAGAIGAVADAVGQERAQRLFAKPQFQSADTMWKQMASGGAEGDPATKILRENARTNKAIEAAVKSLEGLVSAGIAEIKGNVLMWAGGN